MPKFIAYLLILVSLLKPKTILNITFLKKYLEPLSIFLVLFVFSFFLYMTETFNGLSNLISIILNAVFFWFLANILTRRPGTAQKAFVALNAGILLAAVLYLLGLGVQFSDGRLTIFGENANRLGVFAVFSILFILSTIFENTDNIGKKRFFLFLFLIPLLNMIAQTGSRVSFLGLIISISAFFALLKGRKKQARIIIIVIGAIGVYLVYNYFMTFEVIQTRMALFYEEGDVSGRDRIWEGIVPMIKQNPVFGIGISGYIEASQEIGRRVSPHNVFLELLVYSGILGFTAFMLFIYRVFKAAYKTFKIQQYLLPFILVLFVIFVFFSGQGLNVKVFWMLYVFIVATWEGKRLDFLKTNHPLKGSSC